MGSKELLKHFDVGDLLGQPGVYHGVEVATDHTKPSGVMVEVAPEVPLPQLVSIFLQEGAEGPEHGNEDVLVLEGNGYENKTQSKLTVQYSPVVVVCSADKHDDIDNEEPKGMHGTDVVEHVGVIGSQTDKDDEKIQAEEGAHDTDKVIMVLVVKVHKVPEAGHPNIRSNQHSDQIINLLGGIIVIGKEKDLHPALPFLRLVPAEQGTRLLGLL